MRCFIISTHIINVIIMSPIHVEQKLLHMPRADAMKVDDMMFLLVPVFAQQPSEVGGADREHEGVRRQKLRI